MKKDKPIKLCVCLPCILNYGRVAAAPNVFLFYFYCFFFISAALVVHIHKNLAKIRHCRCKREHLRLIWLNICPNLHSYTSMQSVASSAYSFPLRAISLRSKFRQNCRLILSKRGRRRKERYSFRRMCCLSTVVSGYQTVFTCSYVDRWQIPFNREVSRGTNQQKHMGIKGAITNVGM